MLCSYVAMYGVPATWLIARAALSGLLPPVILHPIGVLYAMYLKH